jgi:predicted tellurium resistance membrane protein TerC
MEMISQILLLCFFEIVLGIDNIVLIGILRNRLTETYREKAILTGLLLAFLCRMTFLVLMQWLLTFDQVLFTVYLENPIVMSLKKIVLLFAGLILIARSSYGVGQILDHGNNDMAEGVAKLTSFRRIVGQVVLLDLIASFDTVLTSVGILSTIYLIIPGICISLLLTLKYSASIGNFLRSYPSIEIIALLYILLVGVLFVVEAIYGAIPKGYLYFTISFSLVIELLKIRKRAKACRRVSIATTKP